jgi:hypothetical protein
MTVITSATDNSWCGGAWCAQSWLGTNENAALRFSQTALARSSKSLAVNIVHVPKGNKTIGFYIVNVARGSKSIPFQVNHTARGSKSLAFHINNVARGSKAVPFSQVQLARGNFALRMSYFIAIYNLDKFRILYEFASDGIVLNNVITSSSTSTDKGPLNLKNDIIEKYWEGVSTSEWLQVDCGLGRAPGFDTIALIGHNLSNGAIVNVYGYGTSLDLAPVSWAGVPLYTTMAMPLDRPNETNLIWLAPSIPLTGFRHWRVTISDPANALGKIRVGRFVAGRSFILAAENFEQDLSFDLSNYKDEMSLNGFTSIANNRALKKNLKLNFRNLEIVNKGNYKQFRKFSEYARDTLKSLVIPDPQDPYTYAVFAKLESMPKESHRAVSKTNRLANFELNWSEAK